jgi:hypothetical protein
VDFFEVWYFDFVAEPTTFKYMETGPRRQILSARAFGVRRLARRATSQPVLGD